ncbi:ABC transporter permease [Streptomyces sp. JNUCC 64]
MRRTALARVPGRLAVAGGLLVLLSLVVHAGVDLLPGDPATARLGPGATPEQAEAARERLGLDEPLHERYLDWATGLLRGDLGTSAGGTPVGELLADRLGNTTVLVGLTVLLLVPASLALGVALGHRAGRRSDRVGSAVLLLTVAVPEFVVASLLVLLFAGRPGLLPAVSLVPAGEHPLAHPEVLVLPVLSLLLTGLVYAARVIRAQTAAALRSPHVEFMRLNGLPERAVLRQAVLPAVLPSAAQIWLVGAAGLMGGTVLVEVVFGYPGIGKLLVTSVTTGDLPVVQALAMITGALTLLATVVADLGTTGGTVRT